MKNSTLIIVCSLLLLLSSRKAFSQEPNQSIIMNRADSMRMAGDIKGTIEAYKEIMATDPNTGFNMYNYACALAMDRQMDSSFKYLYKAIELQTFINPLIDKDFYFARNDNRWKEFEDKLVSQLQEKATVKIKNWDYARVLFKMGVYDQAYYDELNIATKQFGGNSIVVRAIWDNKEMINKKNESDLDSLIKKFGFPRISDVGKEAAGSAFLIIQHSDLQMQEKYIDLVKTLCEQNEASWQSYALMYDRIQVSQKKSQKYGTQFKINESTKLVELLPMENESMVDEWRKELGLQSLAAYLKYLRWQYEPKKKS